MSGPQVNARTPIRDPFAVVPVVPENVEQKRDGAGALHLRLILRIKGLKKAVADWLGYDYSRKLVLDELGSLYYGLIDGRRTLGEIVNCMLANTDRSRADLEKDVIMFTKTLMMKNMLMLQVPDDARRDACVAPDTAERAEARDSA